MGLDSFSPDDDEQSEDSDEEKVAYIYVRSQDNMEAYNLMSTGLGGSAFVRNVIKNNLQDYDNQHDYFQKHIVALEPLFKDGDWVPLMEELGVTPEAIFQFMDENPEVKKEVLQRLKNDKSAQSED